MAHTFSSNTFHIIFSTKERLPLIAKEFQSNLYAYIASIINKEFGFCHGIGGTKDHIHILANFKPSYAPADVMREIKSNASR